MSKILNSLAYTIYKSKIPNTLHTLDRTHCNNL